MLTTNPNQESIDFLCAAAAQFDHGGELVKRKTGVTCPGCRSELAIGELQGSQFAGCLGCGGMLFQQKVFAMLVQHLRATYRGGDVIPTPMDSSELRVRRLCPTCDNQLETHAYGGPGNAVIDTCFPCQVIFLDRGELTKLVEAPGRR